ncbi:MAG: carboxypeptidase-like regulatory domain-containing protein [Bacteroidota bacterium]
MRTFLLCLLAAWAAGTASAQSSVVAGTVTDAETGDPLVAVNVAIVGPGGAVVGGTTTNAEGSFSLRLAAFPATLAVRFLGYQTARIVVDDSTASPLQIALRPDAAPLGEVVVRAGENPAVTLMRRVIYKTRLARDRLGPYAVTAYARTTLRGPDSSIVGVTEAVSDAYWSPEVGWREVVVASRETDNLQAGAGAGAVADGLVDLLASDVEVAGHRLFGPTHPDALGVYDVLITGEGSIDGRRVVEVSVEPFARTSSAFVGTLQILFDTADVLSADLRPGPAFLFPPPLHIEGVRFRQQYVPVSADSSLWLPADLGSEIGVGLRVDALLSADPIRVERTAQFSDYRLGVRSPDGFADGEAVRTAPEADGARLDEPGVRAPLTDDEAAAYAAGEDLGSPEDALVFRGLLAPLARRNVRVASASRPDSAGAGDRPLVGVSVAPRGQVNPAETLRLGAGLRVRIGDLRTSPRAEYRVADGGLSYGAEASYPAGAFDIGPRGFATLAVVAEAADDVQRRVAPAAPNLTAYGVNGRGGYYASRRASVGVTVEAQNLGTISDGGFTPFDIEAEASLRFVAETASTYGDDPTEVGVLDADVLLLGFGSRTARSLRLDGSIGTLSGPLGLVPRRAVGVTTEWAPAVLGGPVFWRADAYVDARVTTFGRRRVLPAALDLRLSGGLSGGDVPAFRLFAVERALGGGGVAATTFGALRSRTDVPEAGRRYGMLAWEHSFRTIPFEVVGLDALTRRAYNLILHGAHARTWGGVRPSERWHHEVGVSLAGLLGVLRLDVTTRLDAPGTVVGVGLTRPF